MSAFIGALHSGGSAADSRARIGPTYDPAADASRSHTSDGMPSKRRKRFRTARPATRTDVVRRPAVVVVTGRVAAPNSSPQMDDYTENPCRKASAAN